jgi:hypothetical protein
VLQTATDGPTTIARQRHHTQDIVHIKAQHTNQRTNVLQLPTCTQTATSEPRIVTIDGVITMHIAVWCDTFVRHMGNTVRDVLYEVVSDTGNGHSPKWVKVYSINQIEYDDAMEGAEQIAWIPTVGVSCLLLWVWVMNGFALHEQLYPFTKINQSNKCAINQHAHTRI